jgi:hypothetical protein
MVVRNSASLWPVSASIAAMSGENLDTAAVLCFDVAANLAAGRRQCAPCTLLSFLGFNSQA